MMGGYGHMIGGYGHMMNGYGHGMMWGGGNFFMGIIVPLLLVGIVVYGAVKLAMKK